MGTESGKAFQASNVLLLSLPRPVTARLASGQGQDGSQAVDYAYKSLIQGFNGARNVDGMGQGRLAEANGIGVQRVGGGDERGRFPTVRGCSEHHSGTLVANNGSYGPKSVTEVGEVGQGLSWQPVRQQSSNGPGGQSVGPFVPVEGKGIVYGGAAERNGMNVDKGVKQSNHAVIGNGFGDGTSRQYEGAQNGSLQPQSAIPQHRCCHQVPYDVCIHKKAHLSGISAELDAVCEQLVEVDAHEEHVKELQKECKRLLEIKNALKSVCSQPSAPMQIDDKETSPNLCVQGQSAGPTSNIYQGHQAMHTECGPSSGLGQGEYPGYQQQADHGHSNATYRMSYESTRQENRVDANPEWNDNVPAQPQILEVDAHSLQRIHADRVDASNDPAWKKTDFPWSNAMDRHNVELFGNSSFRLHQLAVINATLAGRDVFVLMPTGGGKSLCYQLPAVLSSGVTIVVTPLVSLIQDQVFHLTNLGISAKLLASYEKNQDGGETMREVMRGNVKVLFLTPEKLEQSAGTRGMLEKLHAEKRLSRVVIDEAHCVSQWGHGASCFLYLHFFTPGAWL